MTQEEDELALASDYEIEVRFYDDMEASVRVQVEETNSLRSVSATLDSNPIMLVYEAEKKSTLGPMVIVLDINAPSWSEFPELEISKSDTDFGRLSGIAFVEKVLRTGSSKFEGFPIILLTEKPSGPWMQRVKKLQARSGAEIVVVSKEHPKQFLEDVTRLVDVLRAKPSDGETDQSQEGQEPTLEERPKGRNASPHAAFLDSLIEFWKLPPHTKFQLLGVDAPSESWLADILTGKTVPPTRDINDRLECLFEIRAKLGNLFRDRDTENKWLRTPIGELGGKTPEQLLLSGSMENFVILKSYVFYICRV